MARFHVLKLLDCLHWPCLRWGQGTLCRHPHQDRLAQNMAGAEDHTELVNIDEPRTTGKPWKIVFQPSPLVRIISYNCLTYLTFPNRSTSQWRKTVWVWHSFEDKVLSEVWFAVVIQDNHPGLLSAYKSSLWLRSCIAEVKRAFDTIWTYLNITRAFGRIIPNNPKMMIEYDWYD